MTPADADDRGEPDPILAGALAGGDTAAALARVLLARLLLPVVATGEPAAEGGGDKQTDMSVPALIDARGARALPAFTGTASLQAWRADARPVPMPGARVVAGAVAEGYDAVVIDVAGPHPLQLTGPVLHRLCDAANRLLAGEGGTVRVVTNEVTDPGRC